MQPKQPKLPEVTLVPGKTIPAVTLPPTVTLELSLEHALWLRGLIDFTVTPGCVGGYLREIKDHAASPHNPSMVLWRALECLVEDDE